MFRRFRLLSVHITEQVAGAIRSSDLCAENKNYHRNRPSAIGNSALRRRDRRHENKSKWNIQSCIRRDGISEVHPEMLRFVSCLTQRIDNKSQRESIFADADPSWSCCSEDRHVRLLSVVKPTKNELYKTDDRCFSVFCVEKIEFITAIAYLRRKFPFETMKSAPKSFLLLRLPACGEEILDIAFLCRAWPLWKQRAEL